MADASKINDFVIKFANVNGSGSASANLLTAKALFRMGLTVSPKNIFPSNIQGLPTWYEIRVNDKGYTGRRAGADVMVAMNAQTYKQDAADVLPGGTLIYDSTLPREFARDDIRIIGIPIAQMCAEAYSDPRQRQLFKNITYVGALSLLLDIDFSVIEQLIGEQFSGKEKLIEPNLKALNMGRDYVRENVEFPLSARVEHGTSSIGKIMISGNEAAGLGAVYSGATVVGWYPITPSTSLVEAFEKHANKYRRSEEGLNAAIVQSEDELAAIGIAIGAGWNGARAFTATSGPGLSLMQEFLGLAYFAEVPVVLFDVQRGGPSTGMPTRTQQSDILSAAYASHGDTRQILLFPSEPNECFTMSADAFDLAERYQTPIIVMSDLDIGMNDWISDPLEWDDARKMDRGKVLTAEDLDRIEIFGRYMDLDGDGIGHRTYPGTHPDKGAYFTRGSSHNELAGYTEDGQVHVDMCERINRKIVGARSVLPQPVIRTLANTSKLGVINVGPTDSAIIEALDQLAADGYGINHMRVRAFPFADAVREFADDHDVMFVFEQNRDGQLRQLLVMEAGIAPEKLMPVLNYDGMPFSAEFVKNVILSAIDADHLGDKFAAPITAA